MKGDSWIFILFTWMRSGACIWLHVYNLDIKYINIIVYKESKFIYISQAFFSVSLNGKK